MVGLAQSREFHRQGRGDSKVREVEQRAHGRKIARDLASAVEAALEARGRFDDTLSGDTLEELKALGVVLVFEGPETDFPLKLDSLDRMSRHRTAARPQWLLLSVTPADETRPERAVVWISDEYRASFLRLFENYLDRSKDSPLGRPRNRGLIANINAIRQAVARDLWQSSGEPGEQGTHWWELWLSRSGGGVTALREYAVVAGVRVADRILDLSDRTIVWVEASWAQLQPLPFTSVPLAEIRRPEFTDTVQDLPREERDDLVQDLADRLTAAAPGAPAVCHLDSGVNGSHVLLRDSLDSADIHSVVDAHGEDRRRHGTRMAGLALYGPLEAVLLSSRPVRLVHRLESVKILPDLPNSNDPRSYGLVTAQAAAAPEAVSARSRVFCMPVSDTPDGAVGEPTLWSASVDALSAGTDIGRSDSGIQLLGPPNPAAARLFVVSAGNVRAPDFNVNYRDISDLSAIEDPGQAWNALTVGAYTDLVDAPSDPTFAGWRAVGGRGDLSPHSRTSVVFPRPWPIKPDICMEGGNVLTDGQDFHESHDVVSLRTTDAQHSHAIGSANATSAATAQAARLGALAMAYYPTYWPETVRGLLVHAADWTPAMRAELGAATNKGGRLPLLRRFGWGVPEEAAVLTSSRQAVTLVTQDQYTPFEGERYLLRSFRLHRLPWPTSVLQELGAATVQLRVTLSYFIEPSASRRGWRRRYSYASHGLRFDLKTPTETVEEFVDRVNNEADVEESGARVSSGSERWMIGSQGRSLGSLHQDIWEGSAADLAQCGVLAVNAVGGWWKNGGRKDRVDLPVRYSLIVSLRTAEVTADLYTPIAVQLELPIETMIAGN